MDVTRAGAAVVTHTVELEREVGGGSGADEKGDGFARADAGVGTITFNPGATIFRAGVDAGVREEPVGRAGTGVFSRDQVRF